MVGILALCAGCGGELPDRAWVMVDAEARLAGLELWVEGNRVAPAVPLEVEVDLELGVLDADGGLQSLWTEPGAIHHVLGPEGEVWTGFVGDDVDPDRIALIADPDASERIADAVGGALEEVDGELLLVVGEVYDALASVELSEALDLWPVEQAITARVSTADHLLGPQAAAAAGARRADRGAEDWPVRPSAGGAVDALGGALGQILAEGRSAADHVGWYCGEDQCLVLGIDWSARECAGDECTTDRWQLEPGGIRVGARLYTFDGRGLSAAGLHLNAVTEGSHGL